MSDHEVVSDEVVGNRYIVTCACGTSYEDEASSDGSGHVWNQMQGHLLGSRSNRATEETLSFSDAADIWLSNGMDEDYMFGYGEQELRRAAGLD
jgi:hypothetical protein